MIFAKKPLCVVSPLVRGRAWGQKAWVYTGNLRSCCTLLPSPPAHPGRQHSADSVLPPASLWLLEGYWLSPAHGATARGTNGSCTVTPALQTPPNAQGAPSLADPRSTAACLCLCSSRLSRALQQENINSQSKNAIEK